MDLKIGDYVMLVPIKGMESKQNWCVLSLLKKHGPNIVFKIVSLPSFNQNMFKVEYEDRINSVHMSNWNFIKCDVFTLPEELFVL